MYTTEVKLKDCESLYVLDQETGDSREIKSASKKRNPDIVSFKEGDVFIKQFPKAWEILYNKTTPLEYKIAQRMAMMVKMMTNSLEPLDDDYTYQELADDFGVSKTKAISAFKKLFTLGVYGKFDVYNADHKHTKYWVFNPYLAMNGKAMSKETLSLFANTTFAKIPKEKKE